MQLLKKIPFFLILLAAFFCLHGAAENYGAISVEETLLTGLSVAGSIGFLFVIILFITRKTLFAALITFFISLWYFFFGAFHDPIKSTPVLNLISSYTIVIPLLFIATFLWIVLLKRNPNLWQKLCLYLNVLLIIYCVIDAVKISFRSFRTTNENVTLAFNYEAVKNKPDVFFLLFDGYPGTKSLIDSFNFDNKPFLDFLTKNNFVYIPGSSNYDLTVFSMSSLFNMDYIKGEWHLPNADQKDVQKRMNEIKQASVFKIFSGMGYTVDNNSIFDIQNAPGISDENSFLLGHSVLLTDKIFINRFNRDIGASLPQWLVKKMPFLRDQSFYRHRNDNAAVEDHLLKTATQKNIKPIFSYSHFLMPHGPYFYDSTGIETEYKKMNAEASWANKNDFISYLKYSNSVAEKVISALRKNKPNGIIIIKSDHGFRYYNSAIPFQPARFDNITWIFFPDKHYGNTTRPLTDVNFFPYLFNNHFNNRLPFSKDSAIHIEF
jgi:hypothetical protein